MRDILVLAFVPKILEQWNHWVIFMYFMTKDSSTLQIFCSLVWQAMPAKCLYIAYRLSIHCIAHSAGITRAYSGFHLLYQRVLTITTLYGTSNM